MRTLGRIYMALITVAFLAVSVLHFANPNPLIQIPDRGHRIFTVPEQYRSVTLSVLGHFYERPWGTFTAGTKQTLLSDGFTVIASGKDMQSAALSIPVDNPEVAAAQVRAMYRAAGVRTTVWEPPEAELQGKLVVVQLPFGWDIALRLPGQNMPYPKWE